MENILTIDGLRELIKIYYKQHKKLPKEIVFGERHFVEFVHIFQDMGRLVPEKFDGVSYNKDNSIIGVYLRSEDKLERGKKAMVKIFNEQIEVLRGLRDQNKQIIKLLTELVELVKLNK